MHTRRAFVDRVNVDASNTSISVNILAKCCCLTNADMRPETIDSMSGRLVCIRSSSFGSSLDQDASQTSLS